MYQPILIFQYKCLTYIFDKDPFSLVINNCIKGGTVQNILQVKYNFASTHCWTEGPQTYKQTFSTGSACSQPQVIAIKVPITIQSCIDQCHAVRMRHYMPSTLLTDTNAEIVLLNTTSHWQVLFYKIFFLRAAVTQANPFVVAMS